LPTALFFLQKRAGFQAVPIYSYSGESGMCAPEVTAVKSVLVYPEIILSVSSGKRNAHRLPQKPESLSGRTKK
jgi:hypothetical protein